MAPHVRVGSRFRTWLLGAALAAALAGGGCDLGSKTSGAGGGGGGQAVSAGPSTSFAASALQYSKAVTTGSNVDFGPATCTNTTTGAPVTCGVQIVLQSAVGAQIVYTSPAAGSCASTGTGTYIAYAGAFSVTDTQAAPSIGVCFYSSLNGVAGPATRIVVMHLTTAPTPKLFTNGVDPAGPPPVLFTRFPTITMGFVSGTGSNGTIYYTTDGTTPTVDSPNQMSVLNGVGASSFVFTNASRMISMIGEDLVGNVSAAPVVVTLQMQLATTTPSAGYYAQAQNLTLVPPTGNFVDGISAEYLLLCQYTLAAGYQCYNSTLTALAASPEVLPVTTAHHSYNFGAVGTGDDEIISLPGIAGQTVVYDARFALDPLGSGSLDATQQAYFVVDRDMPDAIIYADPDRSDNDQIRIAATVFDRGAFTVSSAKITNFALKVNQLDPAELCAGSVAVVPPCIPVNQATVTVPSGSILRPQPSSTLPDNSAVAVTVTAQDAAGNSNKITRYMPIGRTVLGGPAGTAYELGYALAQGNFNCDAACQLTAGTGSPDAKLAPDVVVGEPGRGAGFVYIFYDGLRHEVTQTSGAGAFTAALNLSAAGLNTTTIPLQVVVDGTTLTGTVDVASQLTSLTSVTATQLADAFNKEIMRLKVQSGTDLQLFMTAQGKLSASTADDTVTIHSATGSIETCVTIDQAATGNVLVTALFGAGPVGPKCVYDAKIQGENAGDRFGHAIVTGDFNGDGYDDIAVGAPKYDGGGTDSGRVYVFHSTGAPAAPTFPASAASANAIITGSNANDDFGWSLAAGNFDGAFNKDLVVGAPGYTDAAGPYADAGKVYMFLSGAAGFAAAITADTGANTTVPSATLTRPQATTAYILGERFGQTLLAGHFAGTAGTTDKVIVGAPGAELLSGSASRTNPADSTTANPGTVYYYSTVASPSPAGFQQDARGVGRTADSKFGWSIAAVPSMYGDICPSTSSTKCIAIGAPHDEPTEFLPDHHGAVYIDTYGSFAPHNVIFGSAAGVELGIAVAGAEINGDGYTDLIIGQRSTAVSNFTAPAYGGIVIVAGKSSVPSTLTAARSFSAIDVDVSSGIKEQAAFGWQLLPLDTDGGGVADQLIVGAPGGAKKVGSGNVSGRVHKLTSQTFKIP